jgi:hypothetical protein
MLVTNPQSDQARYCNAVVLYAYMIEEPDGPSFTAWLYPDAEAALDHMREMWGIEAEVWQEIPDQLPGCQDDWIAPVRIPRAANGGKLYHQWEKLVDDEWVPVHGAAGGYGLQIDAQDAKAMLEQPPE